TIPSALQPWLARRFARRPPIVVMVREIHAAMLSNYGKWAEQYPAALAEYARGDPSGRRFIADAWWYVHFFNRWGAWAAAEPGRVLLIRYEDLVADPATWLARVATHLRLDF
ncbi:MULTISPECIES: sulfotransferase, partial [Streptomyces]